VAACLALPQRAVTLGAVDSAEIHGLVRCDQIVFANCFVARTKNESCKEPCVAECKDILEFSDEFASGEFRFLESVNRGCSELPNLLFLMSSNHGIGCPTWS